MKALTAAVVLLLSLVACRADDARPTDPGFDGIETTLDAVEAEIAEP
ncbi:hypothetical protein F4560_000487 [Saccharothrix ecbatanensis]|uniref:Uncharacterized protein n=1 Tax=Saccharothrix ecbatanensis TaxID=1105145 RepID=A0A7W9HEC0_9PSEU|nr:hypothetical protein [Saccharothrix ecbatanensis]MBB5800719.1 hypothetical protein [Saccharothrix ecbatanensis]